MGRRGDPGSTPLTMTKLRHPERSDALSEVEVSKDAALRP